MYFSAALFLRRLRSLSSLALIALQASTTEPSLEFLCRGRGGGQIIIIFELAVRLRTSGASKNRYSSRFFLHLSYLLLWCYSVLLYDGFLRFEDFFDKFLNQFFWKNFWLFPLTIFFSQFLWQILFFLFISLFWPPKFQKEGLRIPQLPSNEGSALILCTTSYPINAAARSLFFLFSATA